MNKKILENLKKNKGRKIEEKKEEENNRKNRREKKKSEKSKPLNGSLHKCIINILFCFVF